jgi:hypothetical protein
MTDQCPPLANLLDQDLDTEAHLAECWRCQALLALATDEGPELGAGAMPDFPSAELPDRAPPAHREIGEIVTVDPDGAGSRLVAVVCACDQEAAKLEVAPISTETRWATEWDLLLEPADSSLGYPAMVELWNHGAIPADHIAESLGTLANTVREQFESLYAAVFLDAHPPQAHAGPPVLSEADPRVSFQQDEIERARHYWPQPPADAPDEAAQHAGPHDTLGKRLVVWFDTSGYDADDLARESGWIRSDVDLVLADAIVPTKRPFVEVDRVAELLRQTDIEGDELEDLLPVSVPAGRFPEPDTEARVPAFHRGAPTARRSGRSADQSQDEPTSGQRSAQAEWITGVLAAFEEASE